MRTATLTALYSSAVRAVKERQDVERQKAQRRRHCLEDCLLLKKQQRRLEKTAETPLAETTLNAVSDYAVCYEQCHAVS